MATHSTKVSKLMKGRYQTFTNDTSSTGFVVFASGDYIDFEASLGRAASWVKIVLTGTVAVELVFNTDTTRASFNEEIADTTVPMTEGINGTNSLRLFTTTRLEYDLPAGFPVSNIKLVAYSGAASATQNMTVVGF